MFSLSTIELSQMSHEFAKTEALNQQWTST